MYTQSRATQISALALGIVAAMAFGQADATGFQIRENSVKNLGRANSGLAVGHNDASVVSNNPAAMTNLDKTTIQADVTMIDLTAEFSGGGTTAAGTPLVGGDGGDPGDATAVPALAVVVPLHGDLDRITLGASISAPFGLKTEYDADWIGRYNAIESDVKIVDLTLSAALDVTDRFSVGLGVIYERSDVTLSNGIDFGTIMASTGIPGALPQGADGTVSVSGDDTGFGWLVGLQWRPTDALTIGYSHRSEIDHDLEGDADFTTPASFAGAQALYRALAANPALPAAQRAQLASLGNGFVDSAVMAPLTTPSVDTLSVQYDFSDRFRMMADVQATDWHSLQAVTIDFENPYQATAVEAFNWDDTMFYALGGEFDLNDNFTLRAGVAMDESPTNDEARTPRLPDNDRMLYSIGATWNVSEALSFDAAYTRIHIDSPSIDVLSSSGSRLTGDFKGHADLFGVAAQYRF